MLTTNTYLKVGICRTSFARSHFYKLSDSFLVKNLMLHWLHGARWFWDTLVDADLASNSCSWQWVAGSGADASPYFRIFNPIIQAVLIWKEI